MQINGGFFEIFLDILDSLDRYAILGSRGRHLINSKKATTPKENDQNPRHNMPTN